jgi:hypothetical protein
MEMERKKFYIHRIYKAGWFSTALVGAISVIAVPQTALGRLSLGAIVLLLLLVILPMTSVTVSRSLGIRKLFD